MKGDSLVSVPLRVLVGKAGLDGHDRGAKVVALGLRDAGAEVIYTGLHQTPEAIVRIAQDEGVDVICLSILSGAHLGICRSLRGALNNAQLEDVPVVVGGIIPDDDVAALKELGVRGVFGPGSSLVEITDFVTGLATDL